MVIGPWNLSREADVAPVEELSCDDVVLEVDPASGPREAIGAAAGNDWVLAAAMDLRAGGCVRIPLGGELVGRGERPHRPAIEAADEDLLAALLVDAAGGPVGTCQRF